MEEDVKIPAGVEIGYSPADCERYFVTPSGIVVVMRHAVETRPARAATIATA